MKALVFSAKKCLASMGLKDGPMIPPWVREADGRRVTVNPDDPHGFFGRQVEMPNGRLVLSDEAWEEEIEVEDPIINEEAVNP